MKERLLYMSTKIPSRVNFNLENKTLLTKHDSYQGRPSRNLGSESESQIYCKIENLFHNQFNHLFGCYGNMVRRENFLKFSV